VLQQSQSHPAFDYWGEKMARPIIVLGMHRSGTSLLAEVVGSWGAYAGDSRQLIGPAETNMRGFWEFEPLVTFNRVLLASLDSDWSVPPPEGCEKLMKKRASEAWFKTRARDLISHMDARGTPWFWKDPRLSILLPFWKPLLEATYVISVRNPTEVALSLFKRNGLPTSAGLLLWQYYLLSLLRQTQNVKRKIFIRYDALVARSKPEFRRLIHFLNESYENGHADKEQLEKMMSVVAPELNHYGSETKLACCSLTREQRNLQRAIEKKVSDPESKDFLSGCELYPGWREYLQVCYALQSAVSFIS
jgi:hypothetical protein